MMNVDKATTHTNICAIYLYCECTYTRVYGYICIYTYTSVYFMFIYVHTYIRNTYIYTHTQYKYACINVNINTVFILVYIHVCWYSYRHTQYIASPWVLVCKRYAKNYFNKTVHIYCNSKHHRVAFTRMPSCAEITGELGYRFVSFASVHPGIHIHSFSL